MILEILKTRNQTPPKGRDPLPNKLIADAFEIEAKRRFRNTNEVQKVEAEIQRLIEDQVDE